MVVSGGLRLGFKRLGVVSVSYFAISVIAPWGTSAEAQTASPPPSQIPAVTVDAPSRQQSAQRARRVRSRSAATRRVNRPQQDAVAQPERLAPVVNSQDARAGQVGYYTGQTSTATKTDTPILNTPQSITVLTKEFIRDSAFTSIGEAVRYVPGVIPHQGEGNRDDVVIRGQRSNADFFVNGIRDDVQYYRDFYNIQRLEVLKGPDAMIFGRGGGGGIINRVTKEADGVPIREITVGGNTYPGARVQMDVGQAVTPDLAVRLNAFYENTESYRDFYKLERYGINPTVTYAPNDQTRIKVSYEYLHDDRTTDRGIPSQVRPGGALPQFAYRTDPSTFFGNPNLNYALTDVHIATGVIEHDFDNGLKVKNTSQYANYQKFYQNIFPGGAVNLAGTSVNLSAYNNENDRQNLFNQTDFTYKVNTGFVRHTFLFGGEVGHQSGLSFRQSGLFNGTTPSLAVNPLFPTSYVPVTFANRRNTVMGTTFNDANNTYKLDLGAVYLQDQIEITKYLQIIGGVRFDRFDLESRDRVTGAVFSRTDNLVSPRAGVVLKPVDNVSIYGSYSVSYLPSAGDQFSTLAAGTIVADPEKFENKEVGVKWELNPRLRVDAAVYELERTNQRFPDPNNAGFFILSGKTLTRGFETSVSGYITDQWQMIGGYAYTDARITGATSATITPGKRVGLVPYNTFSLWNRYNFNQSFGAGVGVIYYSDFYASSDDTVRLPSFTRVDAALYFRINNMWRAQLNVENVFNTKYISTADGNNNLTPGSPRVARVTATANF